MNLFILLPMDVHFLGTNGWYATGTGNTTCTLIKTAEYNLILDAGDGFYKLDQVADMSKPMYLFLSHVHLDHIIGLHILDKFNFDHEIQVVGYKGVKKALDNLIRHPYSAPFERLSYEVKIHEIDEGLNHFPIDFECRLLEHSDPCLGYRFRIDSKTITYCTDTGKCENVLKLAEGAELLISECSFKSGQHDSSWPHLTPEDAAMIARDSEVKQLALTHFDANLYGTLEERDEAERIAKQIFPDTIAAMDGQIIQL